MRVKRSGADQRLAGDDAALPAYRAPCDDKPVVVCAQSAVSGDESAMSCDQKSVSVDQNIPPARAALLEICCYSVQCAVRAASAGADRIELCAGVNEGGLTPSYGMLRLARQRLSLPVHPIIRPRGGDFCYNEQEFAGLLCDIACVRELGFPGLVTGVLTEDGAVDLPRMRKIRQTAGTMAITFHRAFDLCRSPLQALAQLADAGVSRVLTSGQQASAQQGLPLLRQLLAQSHSPIIMAGAGVRLDNIGELVAAGLRELHSSAGQWRPSPMRYRRAGVSMSARNGDEYVTYQVCPATVAAMKSQLRALSCGR